MPRRIVIPTHSLVIQRRAFLKKVSQAAYEPKKVTRILQKAHPNDLRALAEIAYNLLHKKFPVQNKAFLQNFVPYKILLRKLGNQKIPLTKKKELLLRQNNQSGGLGFLVPLLAPILGTLISSALN